MDESWYKTTRTDWVIQDRFHSLWTKSGGPVEAALFAKRIPRAGATEFYFTPAAVQIEPDLLREFGAVPCEAPAPPRHGDLHGLVLLEGDQAILERLWGSS